jgi:hypothetical protein
MLTTSHASPLDDTFSHGRSRKSSVRGREPEVSGQFPQMEDYQFGGNPTNSGAFVPRGADFESIYRDSDLDLQATRGSGEENRGGTDRLPSISFGPFSTMYAPPGLPPPMLTADEIGQAYPQLQGTPGTPGCLYPYAGHPSPANPDTSNHVFLPDRETVGYDVGVWPIPHEIFEAWNTQSQQPGPLRAYQGPDGNIVFPQAVQQSDAPLLARAYHGSYPPHGQGRGGSPRRQGYQPEGDVFR